MPAENFENDIRQRVDSLTTLRYDTRYNPAPQKPKLPASDSYDVLIIALLVRVTDQKGSLGLPKNQIEFIHQLLASKKPIVLVCFGNPYLMAHFPEAKTWVAVFGNADVAQRAASRAIFGQTAIGGRIPVTVPRVLKRGSGIDIPASPMKLKDPPNWKRNSRQPIRCSINPFRTVRSPEANWRWAIGDIWRRMPSVSKVTMLTQQPSLRKQSTMQHPLRNQSSRPRSRRCSLNLANWI